MSDESMSSDLSWSSDDLEMMEQRKNLNPPGTAKPLSPMRFDTPAGEQRLTASYLLPADSMLTTNQSLHNSREAKKLLRGGMGAAFLILHGENKQGETVRSSKEL